MNMCMRCGGIIDHGAMQVVGVVVMVVVDRQALGVLAEPLSVLRFLRLVPGVDRADSNLFQPD